MSWIGLWKPEPWVPLPADWFWLVVDALDWLYFYQGINIEKINEIIDQINRLTEDVEQLYVEDQYKWQEIYKIWDKLHLVQSEISDLRQKYVEVLEKMSTLEFYLAHIAPARKIKTIVKLVTQIPEPLYPEEIDLRRILMKVAETPLTVVYFGDYTDVLYWKGFPLKSGQQVEIYVRSPKEVYLRSLKDVNVFALFEMV